MAKLVNTEIVAQKIEGHIIKNYAECWKKLDSGSLRRLIRNGCKCYDPDNEYFEGLEEVVGYHDGCFKGIKESLLSNIEVTSTLLKEEENGSNRNSEVRIFTVDMDLLIELKVLHSEESMAEIIIIGKRLPQEVMNYELKNWNEVNSHFNLY